MISSSVSDAIISYRAYSMSPIGLLLKHALHQYSKSSPCVIQSSKVYLLYSSIQSSIRCRFERDFVVCWFDGAPFWFSWMPSSSCMNLNLLKNIRHTTYHPATVIEKLMLTAFLMFWNTTALNYTYLHTRTRSKEPQIKYMKHHLALWVHHTTYYSIVILQDSCLYSWVLRINCHFTRQLPTLE